MAEKIPSACPSTCGGEAGKASACQGCPNRGICASGMQNKVDPATEEIKTRLAGFKYKVAVMACKGGVGKSSFSVQLARFLARDPSKYVGLIDMDITGPSLAVMMGLQRHQIHQSGFGWSPCHAEDNLGVVSTSFLLDSPDAAVIWRGPRKNGLIKNFLKDVYWEGADYLVVDTPPGTTDEHFALQEYLNKTVGLDGALLVTTPHESALDGLRKVVTLCRKFEIPILGVVENMSTFSCPKCKENHDLFGTQGATRDVCKELNLHFLGCVPLDRDIAHSCDKGWSCEDLLETSAAARKMDNIFDAIENKLVMMKEGKKEEECRSFQVDADQPAGEPRGQPVGVTGQPASAVESASNGADSEDQQDTYTYEPMSIKNVVMVLSGKGGVGKTTVSTQLALALAGRGCKVGLLDADLCGPSVPTVLRMKDREVDQTEHGWRPVRYNKNLSVMSTGFLLSDKNEAIIWRGPKKTSMINTFITGVCWGALDYLVVDTPPGTSDEHMDCRKALNKFNILGAVVVTSPQDVSTSDVRRELTFCEKTETKVVGVLENFGTFQCSSCSELTNIFSKGGGEALANHFKVPFLGTLPVNSRMSRLVDGQQDVSKEMFDKIVEIITTSEPGDSSSLNE